jgi:hypothetical protein
MIDKDKNYSINEIVEQGLLPMLKSRHSIRKWIDAKKIPAVIEGEGKGRTYKIKGSWIIVFLAKWDAGDFCS